MNQVTFLARKRAVMEDPAVRAFTKTIIEAGLQRDPVDAYYDVKLALEILKDKMDLALGN